MIQTNNDIDNDTDDTDNDTDNDADQVNRTQTGYIW